MDRRRAAGALLALAACIACSTAAPTASDQTALELHEGPSEGCYYNFQHYGEGDRIMTNEPCLNCTCHNRMLMCYLKVCPFTKPIGQDCTIEKRADQCCPIVTCPDVPVDLLTSTSTSSPAEYGATGLGKVDKYGCSIHGKYFPEGSKVPPTPNKPCEHCYCIRNMTTCVMQECTLHVDGCTPIYHKDVCCPVRYSCDHLEDEMLLLDDMTTTVRPTPGFLLTTTTMPSVSQASQNCVHDDQIFADGALIKTEVACEHCYCMKGDIVCVVQECGTPMENEGKNCTSLPPRQGQCCPDTYICEGDEILTEQTTGVIYEELTTLSPPRRVEGSGYRNEPDEPYTEVPFEGSGEEQGTTLDSSDMFTSQKQTPQIIDEILTATEESLKPSLTSIEPDKEQNTVPDDSRDTISESELSGKTTITLESITTSKPIVAETTSKETDNVEPETIDLDSHLSTDTDSVISKDDEFITTTESILHYTKDEMNKMPEVKPEIETETSDSFNMMDEVTTPQTYLEHSSSEASSEYEHGDQTTNLDSSIVDEISPLGVTTLETPKDDVEVDENKQDLPSTLGQENTESLLTTTANRIESTETTSVNPVENEIVEDVLPPGRIPGEGDCLLDGITYSNNTNVPNINSCHSSCKCISSIVKCDPILCSPPPEHMDNMSDCQPIYDTPDACCPTYVCHSRETIPPESHSQMSGTESPKPSPESECHGEQCQPDKSNEPIVPELCNSESCTPKIKDQEKECSNGDCENTETNVNISPIEHHEPCSGDTCLPSVKDCPDGKCKPDTGETICNNENGCQQNEACEGTDCVVSTDVKIPINEIPICKDSEDCKVIDTSSCDGGVCDAPHEDTHGIPDTADSSECTGESCRRKEYPQENISPSECSGSDCITQRTEAESSLTTESEVKDETYKESTTEIPSDDYSKSSDSKETSVVETEKPAEFEVTTKYYETAPEGSTEKVEDSSAVDLSESVTEKEEMHIGTSPQMDDTITEIYGKPETEYDQTISPEIQTTKSKEQVTDSIEHITKEVITEYPITSQYEENTTELPKISSLPAKSSDTTTTTTDIESQDQEKHKDDVIDTRITEEFTQMQETSTKSTDTKETTSKLLETVVTEREDYTKKQQVVTESPEEYSTRFDEALSSITEKQDPTKILTPDGINTESATDLSMTESSVMLLPEITTERPLDIRIKDNDDTSTEIFSEITNISEQFTTDQAIKVQQSSESYETKADETTTNKIYDETIEDHMTTEKPVFSPEVSPSEATKIEEEPEYQLTTEMETLPADGDTERKTTESFVKDQENIGPLTDMYDIVTDKQDTYTTPKETQEYVTSVSSTSTEINLVTQTHEISSPQKGESALPESAIKELITTSIPQESDEKEFTTPQPEELATIEQELTTKTTDLHDISLETVSEPLEEHPDTSTKDLIEVSTIATEKTLQEETTPKQLVVTEPQENDVTGNIPIEIDITSKPSTGLETTISPVVSEEEASTKHTETESDLQPSGEITVMPEVHFPKSDESTPSSTETEKKILETSTISQIGGEAITTEYSKETHEDKSEEPDYIKTTGQNQEPSINESTLTPTISSSEVHTDSDDKTIPVSIDEMKTPEEPTYTIPDNLKEITEKQDAVSTDDYVTESIIKDKTSTDSSVDHHDIVTSPSETSPESQDEVTKLDTELQTDQEIYTTPVHIIKEEKVQTESPMSLVTEILEDSGIDKTTELPQTNILSEEEVKKPDVDDVKPQISYTESPQLPEKEHKFETETPSQTYPEKESSPESSFTSPLPEYTTGKVVDIHDVEKIPPITENIDLSMSTEAEKLSPTTESQKATTFVHDPINTYTESYPTDISHESTSVPPVIFTEEQEIPTGPPELSASTTAIYDHEPAIKPGDVPEKVHISEDITEQPQYSVDFTTPDSSKITDTLEEDGVTQKEKDVTIPAEVEKHTISPELITTKYPETLGDSQDKLAGEHEPSKDEEHTIGTEKDITTEGIIYEENPVDTKTEIPVDQDELLHTSDKMDVTTQVYEELTTLKQQSLPDVSKPQDTAGILTTESSEISPSEEDSSRQTLSPAHVTISAEQYTTEKQTVTQLPEMTKTQEIEQPDMQEISTKSPVEESATSVYSNEEFDTATSIPQATEGNIVLQTEISSDQGIKLTTTSAVTTDKNTVLEEDVTLKPDSDLGVSENLQTESPVTIVTEKDVIPVKTTNQDDIINIPVKVTPEEITSEHTETQQAQTESSVAKETDISQPIETDAQSPLETETEISVPIETGIFIPETTEPTGLKETDTLIPKVTEPSIQMETDITVSHKAETSISDVTEASGPKETAGPEKTKTSIPAEGETSIPKDTEDTVHGTTEITEYESSKTPEITEIITHKVTEASVPEVTKTYIPEETEFSTPAVTEASVPEVTQGDLSEETESSAAEVTTAEVYGHKATEASLPEVTESIVPVSDSSIPKETENELINRKSEPTTYKPKDEEPEGPVEQSTNFTPIHSSSETTPYLVELQEHTTKENEDISSVSLPEEEGTRTPETIQTERGDQPLDNIPDKFTPVDSSEELTTKVTFTKTDEQITTLAPVQAGEPEPEKTPEKIDDATEENLTSQSPVPSPSDIGQQTTFSEEQLVTVSPTVSVPLREQEQITTVASEDESTTDKKELPLDSEKTPEHEIMHETPGSEEVLIPTVTKATTISTPEEAATELPIVDDKFTKPEEKPSESYSPTIASELPKPGMNEIQPTEDIPAPDFPSGSSGYGQEPDYVEEDQAFGPGTCRYGGKVYVSAQQIPRDDPCDFCFCFRSDIICLQQSCPPPIHGCHEEPIQGFCCPRYECPVSMATTLNVTTTTTTTTTTLPPHFLPHAYKGAAQRRGCQIKGHSYKVGEVVRASSGPCLHCTCGGDGQMKCDPKACTPEPMLRQMIAAAVSAKRRR